MQQKECHFPQLDYHLKPHFNWIGVHAGIICWQAWGHVRMYVWGGVTSWNTHKQLLTSFQPIPDSSNHLCQPHMTSKIPRTKFPCSKLVVINFWPWTLSIVKSFLLFLSNPASLCSLFMYTLPCCVSCSHLFYPHPHTYHTSNIPG